MTKSVQRIILSPLGDIPFNKLAPSQSNVRHVKADILIEQFAESIAARTLLQSLDGQAVVDGRGIERCMFEMPAAGGRYRSLAELAEVPEFTESKIHVVAGLLLLAWKRMPYESTCVYPLQTAGERIIGCKVSAEFSADAPTLSLGAAFAAAMEGLIVLDLAEELQLRPVRVMGACRIELSGFNDTMRDRLRAYGLFGETISWKLRMFVPTDASGVGILTWLWISADIESRS